LQYLYAARFSSLLRSYPEKTGDAAKPLDSWDDALALLDADLLTTAQDKELAKFIAGLPELLERAAAANSPNLLIAALLEFTDLFNAFYREKQIINPEDPRETETRIAFIYLLKQVMARMLWILGIPAPERM
jgi:arginyl-tRNA synthetase